MPPEERQDQILVIVKTTNEGNGISMDELAAASGLGKPRLSQLVKGLVDEGKLRRPKRGVVAGT